MTTSPLCVLCALLWLHLLFSFGASAATRYVWQESPSPAPPYDSWANAAHVIQDAVDAAAPGDTVLVTNGVYATGSRALNGNNRVVVDKQLSISSVNGPEFTTIRGSKSPQIRCVYLVNGASVSGFTLTNGAASASGGGLWCQSSSAVVSNCVLSGNSATVGGGVDGGTLNACVVSSNTATVDAGGTAGSTLNNCVLKGNSVIGQYGSGGGASGGILNNCVLSGNSAHFGGGASGGTLNNCTLTGNSAYYGGGAYIFSTSLNNCAITGNSAGSGGGVLAYSSVLNNCTITGNSASDGGGVYGSFSTLKNCIVYFNSAASSPNHNSGINNVTMNYCCASPLPTNGVGNIDLDPQMASASHLSTDSPCRGSGNTNVIGTDLDGEAWANPPSIGCDEYHAGSVTGPLSVEIVASSTNVATGVVVGLTARIEGRTTASVWEFGDDLTATNQPYANHAWTMAGDYDVVLRAYNETYPAGISATGTVHVLPPPVHYVAADSANPTPPYTSWATAARRIQDAVDAASVSGALVLVTNGTYSSGGRAVYGSLLNRLVVNKPLMVRSVNGPQVTTILGSKAPGGGNGNGAIRCVYLTNGATLSGFMLRNGATRTVHDAPTFRESSGGGVWCESTNAAISDCVLVANSAYEYGGGAYQGTLHNCTLTDNSSDNSAGGVYLATLNNSALSGNTARYAGGGSLGCLMNNCTLTGNSAGQEGGGALGGTLNNCIVYFNTAPLGANYSGTTVTLNYCCTTPMPGGGTGNITDDPQLASASHLTTTSPCRGAGNPIFVTGTDIDGEAWASPPSIGCDEYHAGGLTGPLVVAIAAAKTYVPLNYPVALTALIDGKPTTSVWVLGDGSMVTNRPYTSHSWGAAGDYEVVLTAYNASNPGGISATVTVSVVEHPVHYAAANSPNPVSPYTTWATAARNIQDAVDAAVAGEIVVSNGTYSAGTRVVMMGGSMPRFRVAVDKPLTVRSVNGPQFTTILGSIASSIQCAYLTNDAYLSGFTLANGRRGVWCESRTAVVSNCVITGNSATSDGGGAYQGTLNNCVLVGNSTTVSGGGAYFSTLRNSVLRGNSASRGGGAYGGSMVNCTLVGNTGGGASSSAGKPCTMVNCIAYYNTPYDTAGPAAGFVLVSLENCCTTSNSGTGGNITNAPLFVDTNGWSNLRLQSNSPCINAGNNAYVTSPTDLDGNPRIIGGTVDMGAYEQQSPTLLPYYTWLQHYGLPTDGSADAADTDLDGHNAWQEWKTWTDPTNALSVLKLLTPQPDPNGMVVSWQSVLGQSYFLERATNASGPFSVLRGNIPGQAGTTSVTDTNPANGSPILYRVAVPE